MMEATLELFHRVNPYRDFPIADYPKDLTGWHSDDRVFESLLAKQRPGLIIEVGSWKGASAIHMAKILRKLGLHKSRIVCVDTWLGSLEFWTNHDDPERYKSLKLKNGYPTVYYQFLANVIHSQVEDVIIPFPVPSMLAARWFRNMPIKADLIYIDGSHEQSDVLDDLRAWWPIVSKDGKLFGDDYMTWPSVKLAVDGFAEGRSDLCLITDENKYILHRV